MRKAVGLPLARSVVRGLCHSLIPGCPASSCHMTSHHMSSVVAVHHRTVGIRLEGLGSAVASLSSEVRMSEEEAVLVVARAAVDTQSRRAGLGTRAGMTSDIGHPTAPAPMNGLIYGLGRWHGVHGDQSRMKPRVLHRQAENVGRPGMSDCAGMGHLEGLIFAMIYPLRLRSAAVRHGGAKTWGILRIGLSPLLQGCPAFSGGGSRYGSCCVWTYGRCRPWSQIWGQ